MPEKWPINGVRSKMYANPNRKDWAEVLNYTNDQNLHFLQYQADDGDCMRSYMTEQQIAEHLAEFNGLYELKITNAEVRITKDCVPVTETLTEAWRHTIIEAVLNAVSSEVLQENYTGYTHNYEYGENQVWFSETD